MFRRSSRKKDYLSPSVGWLFADLLLVLSIVFMISYVPPPPAPAAKPTPTPTPTPTRPPNSLVLDRNVVQLNLNIQEPAKLSQGDPAARSQLSTLVRQRIVELQLQKRRAGIVIAYGGTVTKTANDDTALAFAIDRSVYSVLADLGQQKFVFCNGVVYYYSNAKNHEALFNLGIDYHMVRIDIFLFNDYFSGC